MTLADLRVAGGNARLVDGRLQLRWGSLEEHPLEPLERHEIENALYREARSGSPVSSRELVRLGPMGGRVVELRGGRTGTLVRAGDSGVFVRIGEREEHVPASAVLGVKSGAAPVLPPNPHPDSCWWAPEWRPWE